MSGSVLVANDGSGDAVMTANMDMTVTGGAVVRVQTASGIQTLSNGVWSASNVTGPLLDQVFPATGGRRSLLQGTDTSNGFCGGKGDAGVQTPAVGAARCTSFP